MNPELKAVLATLRAEYRQTLPERLSELNTALMLAVDAPRSAPLRAEARHLAHKLRGTAGSYGFSRISQAMAVIEDILRRYEEESAPTADEWSQIRAAFTLAQSAIDDELHA